MNGKIDFESHIPCLMQLIEILKDSVQWEVWVAGDQISGRQESPICKGSAELLSDRLAADLPGEFQARNRTICCRELIGHYLSMPEGRAKVRDQRLLTLTCGKCARDAVELLEEAL